MKINRRSFLVAPFLASSALLLSSTPALADRPSHVSDNGWPILDHADSFKVEGCDTTVALAAGMPQNVLSYIIRRWNYEIETLQKDSVWSFRYDSQTSESFNSNFASGTAIYINEHKYPVGSYDTFYPQELAVIENIIEELQGAVVWGGAFDIPVPGLFQIAYGPDSETVEQASVKAIRLSSNNKPQSIGVLSSLGG